MRAAFIAIFLAACATTPPTIESLARDVAGCWINRASGQVSRMNWQADTSGGLAGELVEYAEGAAVSTRTRYTLSPAQNGWRLCDVDVAGQPCWQVAQGNTGSLEGGRAFIDRFGDRLRIGVVAADGAERNIFEGLRAGCG